MNLKSGFLDFTISSRLYTGVGVKTSFFNCVALAKADLVVGPLRPSICPSIRNTFGVPSLCNL